MSALAALPHPAEVTDLPARLGWLAGLLLLVALVYWLMRQGWQWRATLQGDLPPLPTAPAQPGPPLRTLTGRYHCSTTSGQWLDRIVAHGLGTRSRADLTLTAAGLDVCRPGAADFFVPAERLRGARIETGIAGKVLPGGGLLIVTWTHGDRLLDSGFRADRVADQQDWVTAVRGLAGPAHPAAAHGTEQKEGARP